MFKRIPLIVKIALCIVFPPFIIIWLIVGGIGSAIPFAAKESTAYSNLVKYPSEQTALEYINVMNNRPKLRFTNLNRPDVWAKIRKEWQIVNHSSNVPTHLKREVLNILVNVKGLHVSPNVIDNYKGPAK